MWKPYPVRPGPLNRTAPKQATGRGLAPVRAFLVADLAGGFTALKTPYRSSPQQAAGNALACMFKHTSPGDAGSGNPAPEPLDMIRGLRSSWHLGLHNGAMVISGSEDSTITNDYPLGAPKGREYFPAPPNLLHEIGPCLESLG